ncbi:hypothetical protein PybrP1_009143 [[Pythium] brassicae (nom. inval.)]|nr:hypothetical protein PybrP1_009143 [[Pythium] brassicae (nom. inval.)]
MAGVPPTLGFATTNNPCEIFNASTKCFFVRRRYHMQQLLQKLIDLVEVTEPRPPVGPSFVSVLSPDVVRAAALFREAGLSLCRHHHIGFSETFDGSAQDEQGSAVEEPDELVSPSSRAGRAAQKILLGAIKWSLRAAHQWGIPADGWAVDIIRCTCQCKYFSKFSTYAYIIVAKSVFKLSPAESRKDGCQEANQTDRTVQHHIEEEVSFSVPHLDLTNAPSLRAAL